jgi:hypothetical protein
MFPAIVAWAAVALVAATATGNLLTRDWRWSLGLLSAQYLGAAALAAQHWPLGMAAARLVAGWMATAALGMTLTGLATRQQAEEQSWPQGRAFRMLLAGMVFILAAVLTPRIENVIGGVGAPVIAGTIVLIGIGWLQLGSSDRVSRIVVGLLTVMAGFEVFYAAVEGSILVAGMLAVVTLGLGLVGAYLLTAAAPQDVA